MKKQGIIYIFIFYQFIFFSGKSQTTFQKTFGGSGDDYAFPVIQSADKGFVLAGYTDSYGAGSNDFYVIKTDSLGNAIWTKTYGGTRDDEAYAVKQTTDGGYIIAGYSKSFGSINYDSYLIKINANGDTLWTKTYGGTKDEYTNSLQQTTDGGFILAGYTTTFVTGTDSGNIYLIKTDALGNLKWTKSFGGAVAISDGYSIQQTTDKGYIITGYTNSFGEPNGDAFLIKTDSIGNMAWTKTYGSLGVDWGNSVQQTSDGGYIIAGSSSFDTTNLIDVYLIKTNTNGDTLWTKTYGSTGYDFGQAIEQTIDGGYIITGYTNSYGAGNYNVYLIKADANGNAIWSSAIGNTGDDEGNSVHQTTDGGYVISGISNSFGAGDYDMYLIKVDANGNTCNKTTLSSNISSPATILNNQTTQIYTANTSLNYIHTLIDTGAVTNGICTSLGVKSINKYNRDITIFPNPNNGVFTISINDSEEEKANIVIKNILGETIYSIKANKINKVDLQNLPNGTYFLYIQSNNEPYSQKIIIIE